MAGSVAASRLCRRRAGGGGARRVVRGGVRGQDYTPRLHGSGAGRAVGQRGCADVAHARRGALAARWWPERRAAACARGWPQGVRACGDGGEWHACDLASAPPRLAGRPAQLRAVGTALRSRPQRRSRRISRRISRHLVERVYEHLRHEVAAGVEIVERRVLSKFDRVSV